MIQNKEIIDWFNNYFYNCYYVKHDNFPESIFMYYDVNYVRQLKLAKLEGKNIEKTDITGICLFQQDWKYKWLRCDYILIWAYFRDNYSDNFTDFQSFIMDRLEEYSKMKVLTPVPKPMMNYQKLEEHSKMKVLTPVSAIASSAHTLEEHSKNEGTNTKIVASASSLFAAVGRTFKNEYTNTLSRHHSKKIRI